MTKKRLDNQGEKELLINSVIQQQINQLASGVVFSTDLLYTYDDLVKILKTTKRNIRRFRQKGIFTSLVLGNRHYYLKSLFVLELYTKLNKEF